MSYESREIHTRQRYCTAFTTFRCHCHSPRATGPLVAGNCQRAKTRQRRSDAASQTSRVTSPAAAEQASRSPANGAQSSASRTPGRVKRVRRTGSESTSTSSGSSSTSGRPPSSDDQNLENRTLHCIKFKAKTCRSTSDTLRTL